MDRVTVSGTVDPSSNLGGRTYKNINGDVPEWLNGLAWKASIRLKRRIRGSNPLVSARFSIQSPPLFPKIFQLRLFQVLVYVRHL